MTKLFNGKVVLITGAGRGLGRKLAEAFAERGAQVAANDITPVNVDEVVGEIRAAGGQAKAYIHDVAKKVDVQAMVNNIVDDFGHIDVLINCARVEPPANLLDIDEWDLHRAFDVNAIGIFLMMQIVGRVMRAQGSGVIINATQIRRDAPASFHASRAGITAMTRRAAQELAPHNIQVYAVTSDQAVNEVLSFFIK